MPGKDLAIQAKTALISALLGLRPWQLALGLSCILAGFFNLGSAVAQEEGTGYVSPHDPANDYLNAIDAIEADSGPYATELSDLYLGLGQSLIGSGDYEQARDAFQRGVMVVRVNSGPNSPEQTNGLYLIANTEAILGEMKAADDILHTMYSINANYYGDDSPELLPVLERIYQWYLVIRPPGSDAVKYLDYERTAELTEKMAQLTEASKGMGHPDTSLAYRRLGEAHFQTLWFMMREEMFSAISSGYLAMREGVVESTGDQFRAGRKAFKKYLESLLAQESSTPFEYAQALADLADWYLLFGKFGEAWNSYEQAYQVLAESEQYAELADSYMGKPKPVYFSNLQPGLLEDAPADLQEDSLDVSMTVTDSGSARSVEVLNAPEGISEDDLGAIERRVRGMIFRPALRDGEVATTRDFIWPCPIVPQGTSS
jgi:tetratricopeptide (TPR) repeat protein